MKKLTYLSTFLSVFLVLCLPNLVGAQTRSIDGNRWYEIEVSIFTNQPLGALNAERTIPANTILTYPQSILDLNSPTSSLEIDFEPVEVAGIETTNTNNSPFEFDFPDSSGEELESKPILGPEYLPPVSSENSFQVQDFATDPFIALGSQFHTFSNDNRTIDSSIEHRLLYHAVWRQPVISKNQSTAIFIKGGDQYGLHSELEGSITISYNVNRVDIDAYLWRNIFTADSRPTQWLIPPPPFIDNENANISLMVETVTLMQEVRSMISNELHYLDHPAFGLLVEVRPYQLPEPEEF